MRTGLTLLLVGTTLQSACGGQTNDNTDVTDAGVPRQEASNPADAAGSIRISGLASPLQEAVARAYTIQGRKGLFLSLHSNVGNCAAFGRGESLPNQLLLELQLQDVGPGTYRAITPSRAPSGFEVTGILAERGSGCESRYAAAVNGTLTVDRTTSEGVYGKVQFQVLGATDRPTIDLAGEFFAPFCSTDVPLDQVRVCAAR